MTLQQARELLSWDQQRLANESGLTVRAIDTIERRRVNSPSYTRARRIVEALRRGGLPGLSLDDIDFDGAKADEARKSAVAKRNAATAAS